MDAMFALPVNHIAELVLFVICVSILIKHSNDTLKKTPSAPLRDTAYAGLSIDLRFNIMKNARMFN